jgi:hypothetical protein
MRTTTILAALALLTACGSANTTDTEPAVPYIPGADSGELTAALEGKGYTVERTHGPEATVWRATSANPQYTYTITYSSDRIGTIQYLSGEALITDPSAVDVAAVQPFIESVLLMPFGTDSTMAAARAWLGGIYATEGHSENVIDGIAVSLTAPTPYVRTLRMQVAV